MKNRDHGLSEKELVQLLMADCESTGDIQAKLKKLFAGTIEQMLEAEMDEHLGYEKNSVLGNNSGNSRKHDVCTVAPSAAWTPHNKGQQSNGYGKKLSPAITANAKYPYSVTAMVNLSLKSLKKDRLTQMKLSRRSWQCMQRECPNVTLKIPSKKFTVQKFLRDLFHA